MQRNLLCKLKSILARWRRFLKYVFNIGTKSTSYAMNISHTRLAESNGYTDALLVNRENIILEGPINVWMDIER